MEIILDDLGEALSAARVESGNKLAAAVETAVLARTLRLQLEMGRELAEMMEVGTKMDVSA